MSEIRLTPAGEALTFSIPVLLLFFALFYDWLIFYALVLLSALALCAFIIAVKKARWLAENLSVKPSAVSLRLIAGGVEAVRARIEAPKPVRLLVKHPMRFCNVKPQPYVANGDLTFEFTPNLAGAYSSDRLDVEASASLSLFTVRVSLPLKTDVAVIPRVVPAALRALKLIAYASMGGLMYEIPLIHRIGMGTEYAETREYMPGDEIRHIDWKATARLQKLMVKQFHEEAGGEINLIYDLKVAGPISADIAATEFLNLATALSAQNMPYRITVIDVENRIETLRFNDWREALITAVKYALKSTKINYTYLYSVAGPASNRELALLLKLVGEEFPIDVTCKLDREGWTDAIVVTCLLGDLTWLLNIWDVVARRGGKLTVYTFAKVWLDSPSLEQAYIDYEQHTRLLKVLRGRGINIEVY